MTASPPTPEVRRGRLWARGLQTYLPRTERPVPLIVEGRLTRMVGLTIEAVGCQVPIGGRCHVVDRVGGTVEAEVVGFSGERLFLMPVGQIHGLSPDARVIPTRRSYEAEVGEALLGRVIDAAGRPLDGKGRLRCGQRVPLAGRRINPLDREPIRQPLDVGVRAINGLLSVGRGQRMGLFAGSGVGKSVLLGMMTRYTDADVTVVGLIGERGREVRDFVDATLGEQGMAHAVVVAAPADETPLMRLHGAWLATAIAEYFREQGLNVLLLMDSLTRFAQAQREIALAVGEPPATKGYPPSVFARLPSLVERAGCGDGAAHGTITGFYTVLTEGDDNNDPIADAARAILDGHVVLSRQIAESGLYPAIDVETSVSRVMHDVVEPELVGHARHFKQLYSVYQRHRDMISVGAYHRGADPRVDAALEAYPRLIEFIHQDMGQAVSLPESMAALRELMTQIGEAAPPAGSGGAPL